MKDPWQTTAIGLCHHRRDIDYRDEMLQPRRKGLRPSDIAVRIGTDLRQGDSDERLETFSDGWRTRFPQVVPRVDGVDASLISLHPPIIGGAEELAGERADHTEFLSMPYSWPYPGRFSWPFLAWQP